MTPRLLHLAIWLGPVALFLIAILTAGGAYERAGVVVHLGQDPAVAGENHLSARPPPDVEAGSISACLPGPRVDHVPLSRVRS